MPEISRFYGIVIQMYYGDHPPPHFHARYGGHDAKIEIDSLSVIEGKFPARALGLVIEWAALHQQELRDAFQRAANLAPPGRIDPLP
ncbi:MAG: DUF4160 domain-containing protein [Pirellulales bacterium]